MTVPGSASSHSPGSERDLRSAEPSVIVRAEVDRYWSRMSEQKHWCCLSGEAARPPRRRLLRQVEGKSEGASLCVSADAPPLPRVDDLPAERANLLQGRRHVRNREIWERHPISGPRPSRMKADRGTLPACLPAFTFTLDAAVELHVQEPAPEPASSGRIVGRKLHESER